VPGDKIRLIFVGSVPLNAFAITFSGRITPTGN
jgi:hypothetical protein